MPLASPARASVVLLAALAALAAAAGAAAPAAGQVVFEENGVAGETSFAVTSRSGNTDSSDLSFGLKLRAETARWRNIFGGNYDWGTANDVDTKNRLAVTHEVARLLNHRLYGFGRAAFEQDHFSGYDDRSVLGVGLGYDVLNSEQTTWSLQGGPAYRVDNVEPRYDPVTGALLTPAEQQTSGGLNLGSRYSVVVNDAVTFSDTADLTSSADTTTFLNSAALTTDLLGSVQARFSLDVLHDTSAPLGSDKTDTTTRASLVYTFGGN
jgi:putative salt-induced outer membrane protein